MGSNVKKQLLEGAIDVFASGMERQRDQEQVIHELHAKSGELTMERDSWSGKLKL